MSNKLGLMLIEGGLCVLVIVIVVLSGIGLADILHHATAPTHEIHYGDRVEITGGFYKGQTGVADDFSYDKVMVDFDDDVKNKFINSKNLKRLEKEE